MKALAEGLGDATHRVISSIRNAIWWVRHRVDPRHRYHLIDTGLPPGYHEIDERLLHGCMRLCSNYVNDRYGSSAEIAEAIERLKAEPEGWSQDGVNHPHIHEEAEALRIYEWWTIVRPREHDLFERECTALFERGSTAPTALLDGRVASFSEFEKKLEKDEEEMLIRLVKIRGVMWT